MGKDIVEQKTNITNLKANIKSRFPYLKDDKIDDYIDKTTKLYNCYIEENKEELNKIIYVKFIIFVIIKKETEKLDDTEILNIINENKELLYHYGGRITFKKISEKIRSNINTAYVTIRFNINVLFSKYPTFYQQNILDIIYQIMNETFVVEDKNYNIYQFCDKYKIDIYTIFDKYLSLCSPLKKTVLYSEDIILLVTEEIIVEKNEKQKAKLEKQEKEQKKILYDKYKNENYCVFPKITDMCEFLNIKDNTFEVRINRLKKLFPKVPKKIIFKTACDFYYIKNVDDRFLYLFDGLKPIDRNIVLLEISLVMMEHLLTYEEAFKIAINNYKNDDLLINKKFSDSDDSNEIESVKVKHELYTIK